MPITRFKPPEVFRTTDGHLFENQEEAQCHERHIQIKDAVQKYCANANINAQYTLYLQIHAERLAPLLAPIVRATPLANV